MLMVKQLNVSCNIPCKQHVYCVKKLKSEDDTKIFTARVILDCTKIDFEKLTRVNEIACVI
jgi:hypothetical protein